MRRDGRSGPSEDRSEYILPNYSTFGIMNTVGNLFHQIEEISLTQGQFGWFINWLQFLGYQLVIQWRRTMFILTWWQCGRAPTDCPLEQGPASSRVESENQARPGGCCDLTRVCLFGSAWVRMMFPPPPPSPQLYNVDTTHHNKLPMSSTWRKYW